MHSVRLACIVLWLACQAAEGQIRVAEPPAVAASAVAVQLLREGKAHLDAKNPQAAIADLDKLIALYEAQYRGSTSTIFGARSTAETLFYLAQAANENKGKDAIVIDPFWGDAYYGKAFALEELGQLDGAKTSLKRALELSPRNSAYLNELGQLYSREKRWDKATETYLEAAEAADISRPETKKADLSRAWRGLAYIDVELGKLAEAESLYRKCLDVDPADKTAAAELRYVQAQQEKLKPH